MGNEENAARPWLRFVVLLAVVATAAAVFVEGFDVPAFLARLAAAEPAYVAVAVAVYAVSWPLRGFRYSDILARTGHRCGALAMTAAVFVSQTSNLVFPARAGDGARAYVVKKRNAVPYTAGAASLAAERVLDLAAVLAIGGAGLVWTVAALGFEPVRGRTPLLAAAGVGAVTLAVIAALYVLRGRTSTVSRGGGSGHRYVDAALDALAEFGDDFGSVFEDRRSVARFAATSLCIWLLDVLTCLALFYALGTVFEGVFAVSLLAVSVGNMAKVVPLTPGGIGLYEAGFAAVVVAATPVGWGAAVAVAVLDHALKNGVTVVGGVVSSLALNVSLTRPAGVEAEPDA
jgi:uncharacterized protein (TIRG00374 family)